MTPSIAVTTTADRFRRWAVPLADHGLRPVSLPCIEVKASHQVTEGRQMAAVADWLLITSPRVVQIMWPDGGMVPVQVAAIGPATAQAVQRAGGTPVVVGDGDGDHLVRLVADRVAARRVVIPHGSRANTRRFRRLAEVARVETVVVYDTVSIAPGTEPVNGAVFGSPSAVEGWSRSRSLDDLGIVGAVGHVTAEALAHRSVVAPIIPDHPTPGALAAALSATLERIR